MSHWQNISRVQTKGLKGTQYHTLWCKAPGLYMDVQWINFQIYCLESLLQSVFIRELNQESYDSGQETVKMPGLELFFVSLHYTRAGFTTSE